MDRKLSLWEGTRPHVLYQELEESIAEYVADRSDARIERAMARLEGAHARIDNHACKYAYAMWPLYELRERFELIADMELDFLIDVDQAWVDQLTLCVSNAHEQYLAILVSESAMLPTDDEFISLREELTGLQIAYVQEWQSIADEFEVITTPLVFAEQYLAQGKAMRACATLKRGKLWMDAMRKLTSS